MTVDFYAQSYWMIQNKPHHSNRAYIVSVLPSQYTDVNVVVYRCKNFKGVWCYNCCFDFEFRGMILNKKYRKQP